VVRNRLLLDERLQSALVPGDEREGFWFDWINARILLREACALIER
ncbi:MAG: hypothetical protein RIQ79_135, partial [Verrucomicrobiota bacterium]